MTIKYQVRIGRARDKRVSEYDKLALETLVGHSILVLRQLIDQNRAQENLDSRVIQPLSSMSVLPGPYWFCDGHWNLNHPLNRLGTVLVTRSTNMPVYRISSQTNMMEEVLSQSVEFVEAIKKGHTPKKGAVHITNVGGGTYKFEVITLTRHCCPRCGTVLHPTSLKRHVDSPICRHRVADAELGGDHVKIQDSLVIQAIKEAGIHVESRPITYATYAPKWVATAIEKFKNKDGKNFAGLKLTQYLAKMKEQ